ncbi:MAG: hypothetical protein WC661_07690 [Opitutaceae bacterium]
MAAAAVLLWPKVTALFAPPPVDPATVATPGVPVPSVPATPPPAPVPDLSPKKWTNLDGRSFEGSLVSAKDGQVILRRSSDSAYFQIPSNLLIETDRAYIQKQAALAAERGTGFATQISGLYTLSRKLPVKGYVVRVADSAVVGGWRHDRVDPTFWFFLSDKLHGADLGSVWVRVDEKTYKAHEEKNLITKEHLINASDASGAFSESLPWPRPQTTILNAKYGSPAESYNVTSKLMRLMASGRLPLEIRPDIFNFPPHMPESWELTVAWRTATGETSRTLRDGSVLTWP